MAWRRTRRFTLFQCFLQSIWRKKNFQHFRHFVITRVLFLKKHFKEEQKTHLLWLADQHQLSGILSRYCFSPFWLDGWSTQTTCEILMCSGVHISQKMITSPVVSLVSFPKVDRCKSYSLYCKVSLWNEGEYSG